MESYLLLPCSRAPCRRRLLVACGKEEPVASLTPRSDGVSDGKHPAGRAYQEHCAQCHGPDAQGHPDWRLPQVTAAPPLNGTGNEWQRSKSELAAAILNGAKRDGVPVMPGWKGRLSDKEVEDVIIWFQALWPAEVYEKWHKANAATYKDVQVPRETRPRREEVEQRRERLPRKSRAPAATPKG